MIFIFLISFLILNLFIANFTLVLDKYLKFNWFVDKKFIVFIPIVAIFIIIFQFLYLIYWVLSKKNNEL